VLPLDSSEPASLQGLSAATLPNSGRPPAALGWLSKISFGLGDFSVSAAWNMTAAFLLFFYTDIALLPAAAVGTIFLVSRLLDAGLDLATGVLVDRTHTRWGKARPYFLFGAIPFGLLCVAVFWSPPLGPTARLVWAAVTFLAFGFMFSIVAIPYNALLPMMTVDPRERLQCGSLRAASTALSVIVATALTMPLVAYFGGSDRAAGFVATASVFAAISVGLMFNLFINCRERVIAPVQRSFAPILPDLIRMICNRAWLVVFLFTTLNFVRFGAVLSVTSYFAINVLRKPQLISVLLPSVSGTLLIGAAIAAPFLRRFGMRLSNTFALSAAMALYAVLPFCESQPSLFVAVFIASSLSLSLTMTAIFSMAAETVDYHQALYGVRQEGMLSAGISLSTKVGIAVGGAITAYGLAAASYDPKAVSQAALSMIRVLYYAPAVITILCQIVCIAFYPAASRFRSVMAGHG
jgi:GPH family glycoside/pentoside/hexuronide:cation symporter